MSEYTEGSPREAAAEPSLAELFDPAALERRLAEARARRTEAIARRTAAGGATGPQPRAPRVRTVDMAAPVHPAPPVPRAPLSLVAAPTPVRPHPPARTAAEPPLAALPPLQGERRRATTMPERLAAAVARPPAASPTAPTVEQVALFRQPLAVLGLGVLLGAAVAGATLVALRQSAPGTASAPAEPAALAQPELRFDIRAPDMTRLGYALPADGAAPIASVADRAPMAPEDAALPAFAPPAPPASPGTASSPTTPRPGTAAVAALPAVGGLPPLDLPRDAAASPAEADAPILVPVAPGTAAQPAPAAASSPSAPLPGAAAVAALFAVGGLPPLDLPRDAAGSPSEADAPALAAAALALPASHEERPAPFLSGLAAPRHAPGRSIAAAPVPPATQERLQFVSAPLEAAVRAALTLPGGLPPEPLLAFALAEEPATPITERPTARRAAPPREAGASEQSSQRVAAVRQRPEMAAPAPVRSTVAASPANREHLERSVENMLRDRLLGN